MTDRPAVGAGNLRNGKLKVIVKSAKIKTVAKNAFAGTKKVTVKVPKKQKKAYKKKFKKAKVK
ncbi:MAG: hypothetical protein PUC55_12225 [Lachnospiraceae bacterium]|nr:hypothetical protein [Lachnospiraceae bacterium]